MPSPRMVSCISRKSRVSRRFLHACYDCRLSVHVAVSPRRVVPIFEFALTCLRFLEPKATESSEKTTDSATEKPTEAEEKPAADGGDIEMKDATEEKVAEGPEANSAAPPADGETAPVSATVETPAGKGKGRRKSAAGESKGKTLNRKNSKARLTHADAKPGDHFLVKLKGFPAWPAIICDESMLPLALVNSRPVTAARPDGTYAEAYADGGKRVNDRSFPVMYLHTNEL